MVLFVCTGNICRSSMAEGFFRHAVTESGLAETIGCESAGLINFHDGNPPDSRACARMARLGIDINRQRSSPVEREVLSEYDYIIAMDKGHHQALRQMCGEPTRSRVRLMMEFADNPLVESVPDPYYDDESAFADVAELLQPAIRGLLQTVRGALS